MCSIARAGVLGAILSFAWVGSVRTQDPVPAQVEKLAEACVLPNQPVVHLEIVGLPVIGNPAFGFRFTGGEAGRAVLLLYSFLPAPPQPQPVGFSGLELSVVATIFRSGGGQIGPFAFPSDGTIDLPCPVPAVPDIMGIFEVQGLVPQVQLEPLLTTEAWRFTFGVD